MFPIEVMANVIVIFVFLAFWTAGFAVLYHLTRFGIGTLPKRLSALFLVGAIALFSTSVIFYQKLDLTTFFS